MDKSIKEWLKNASANFVGSLLAGIAVLYLGTFIINKATSSKTTKNLPEPIKSTLEGMHYVSSDVLGVFKLGRDSLKTSGDSDKRSVVDGDVAYVATSQN